MNIVLSHPTGNANVRAVANGFLELRMLTAFHTSIASFPGSSLDRLGHLNALAEIRRRRYNPQLKPFTKTWPWFEMGRILSTKFKLESLVKHETGIFSVDSMYANFDKKVAASLKNALRQGAGGVYAYEDAALATFQQAGKLGLKCIYDLPIAYWEMGRRLMNEESQRLPKWSKTLGGGINDSQAKLDRKVKELELADMVVVPGQFVYDSLPPWASNKKIVVSHFGTPAAPARSKEATDKKKQQSNDSPLRVLFVGSMGQRKGLGDLFAAIKMLKGVNVELVVMGSLLENLDFYKNELPQFIYEPGRPHHQVLELMDTCDVFCLPSIVEGRALVMQEAMSRGLPLIITPNTGGEDLVIEGKTGFLVPIRSPQKIAEKINWLAEHRSEMRQMGQSAQAHAAVYTWENYGCTVAQAIKAYF